MILRPGGVTKEDLSKFIPNITIDSSIIKEDEKKCQITRPKYRHYAPKAEMLLFSGQVDSIVDAIIVNTEKYTKEGKRVGIICTDETKNFYKEGLIISMGSRKIRRPLLGTYLIY